VSEAKTNYGGGICILCDETQLSPQAILPTCKNCRASIGSWSRRPIKAVVERRQKLHIYDTRMAQIVEDENNPGRKKNGKRGKK
jgi:hypothetical protein